MMLSRRTYLAGLATLIAARLVAPSPVSAAPRRRFTHPTPRKGITAAKVASREQLGGEPEVVAVFDQVRDIPGVIDGIGCQCGCAEIDGFYSLLTCFEAPDVMARRCAVCQSQARLVHRLHKAGKTLDEIRRGVDARFG